MKGEVRYSHKCLWLNTRADHGKWILYTCIVNTVHLYRDTSICNWTRASKQSLPQRYLYEGIGQVLAQLFVIGQELDFSQYPNISLWWERSGIGTSVCLWLDKSLYTVNTTRYLHEGRGQVFTQVFVIGQACKQLIAPRYLYGGRGQVLAQVLLIGQ